MRSLQLRSYVSEDGILRLQIPTDMPNQELEVVVVLQPTAVQQEKDMPDDGEWPRDFFEKTAGLFQNDPLERGNQGEYEIRELLK